MSKKSGKKTKEPVSTKMCDHILASGQLTSQINSSNIKLVGFSVTYHGVPLIKDTDLSLATGQRYGLLGKNGAGKSAMLTTLGKRMVDIPEQLSIFHLDHECEPTEETAIEVVLQDLDATIEALEEEYEDLCVDYPESDRLTEICERLDDLDPDMATVRAAKILHGLGFDAEMQDTKTKEFSGGWRMRVSLARALFISPDILLLDEPTNHLDLEAVVWLETYLSKYPRILLLISHSQDFLNNVCTNIIHLQHNVLTYYKGNFDSYTKTRFEKEENQMKKFKREQNEIKDMKNYIAKFGHGSAKLAKQAQSKEKLLAKMLARGLVKPVSKENSVAIKFHDCQKLHPPVIGFTNVSFNYEGRNVLYSNVDLGVDLDSRIAIVGKNGTGKSTLLKLMMGELTASDGTIKRHSHLRVGWYNQHLGERLDGEMTPLDYMCKEYQGIEREAMRRIVGRYGITGDQQTRAINTLSDGQKSRLVLAWLAEKRPQMLMLDEPTNHLDIETIDSLAEAINKFQGGLVLVSHDFRLISQVATEIWEVSDRKVNIFKGDIQEYKKRLKKIAEKEVGRR